jgi:hypothetical protein
MNAFGVGRHYAGGMNMRRFIGINFVMALIVFPAIASAVAFDFWETGMSINEVIRVAQEHDLPIARENVIHARKRFDPKLIDDNFYKTSAAYYRTNLSGRSATIYLRFTDDPKFVREIEVRLHRITDRELFTKEMLGILSKKYGSYRELKELFYKSYEWRPDAYSRVSMRVDSGGASIVYADLRINKDFEDRRRQKEKESIKRDAGKY